MQSVTASVDELLLTVGQVDVDEVDAYAYSRRRSTLPNLNSNVGEVDVGIGRDGNSFWLEN